MLIQKFSEGQTEFRHKHTSVDTTSRSYLTTGSVGRSLSQSVEAGGARNVKEKGKVMVTLYYF